ncbi:hypothetical protein PUN28_003408 [Cardiocondyla obscurior]|uniref:Uncharacterized protein n=1 Tax=Cardiocondyla obscurior TaxID=286306 RepID=A0AAW2GNS7_9HYME
MERAEFRVQALIRSSASAAGRSLIGKRNGNRAICTLRHANCGIAPSAGRITEGRVEDLSIKQLDPLVRYAHRRVKCGPRRIELISASADYLIPPSSSRCESFICKVNRSVGKMNLYRKCANARRQTLRALLPLSGSTDSVDVEFSSCENRN